MPLQGSGLVCILLLRHQMMVGSCYEISSVLEFVQTLSLHPLAVLAEWLVEGLAGFLTDTYIKEFMGNNEARYRRYKVCATLSL